MLLVEVSSWFQLDQQQLISIKVKLMLPWFTLVVQGIIYSGSKTINFTKSFFFLLPTDEHTGSSGKKFSHKKS